MNRIFSQVIAIVVVGAATAVGTIASHRPHVGDARLDTQTDGAFRDGLFLGRLDASQGRNPHVASGRWSTEADRQTFVDAYLQGYRERQGDAVSEPGSRHRAAQAGYRDGVRDGRQQRHRSGAFQASATENYKKAGRGYSQSDRDLNQYLLAYREAYSNGYQEAYYGSAKTSEAVELDEAVDWK